MPEYQGPIKKRKGNPLITRLIETIAGRKGQPGEEQIMWENTGNNIVDTIYGIRIQNTEYR